ncbi:MAG: hypothetical protein GX254_06990 [Clostridiales bacterium]|nr:hypothetical protein [Clostridiales bacterium]
MFLFRPAVKFGKVYFLIMLTIQALPTMINSLVEVATPKIAIDGIMNGMPFGNIILRITIIILLDLFVGAIITGINCAGTSASPIRMPTCMPSHSARICSTTIPKQTTRRT